MKNIYLITMKEYDYDEYDSWVVMADNADEAIELCGIRKTKDEVTSHKGEKWERVGNNYRDNIAEIKIIGTTDKDVESQIVCSSFNAG